MFHLNTEMRDQEIREKAEKLIRRMSTHEKVMLLSGNWKMIRDAMKYKRAYNPVPIESHGCKKKHIEPVKFTDGPRGVVMGNSTCFPVSIARAATFDRELEKEIGEAIGREARAGGANYFGGVCVNLMMHPAGGRSQESYGEDPYLVGEMGAKLVEGVQTHNVMACAKHYAVNNMENRRFHVDVDLDERTLREVYLPQFKKCVDQGCASLMGSYNRFRGEQASESAYLLTKILREEWGFEGFTITDFIFALRNGAKALNAGMDMEMPIPVHFGKELEKAVEKGTVTRETLDLAVRRVLCTQLAFQNTSDPIRYTEDLIACPEHIALARRAAEESMVLLKNEKKTLPFSKDIKRLLVAGHLAGEPNTGDHGSSSVYPPYVVTYLDGLKHLLGDQVEIQVASEAELEKAKEYAKTADAVIVIAGNDYADEGEFVVPDESIDSTQLMIQGLENNGNRIMAKLMKTAAKKSSGNASYTSDDNKPVGGDRRSLSLRDQEIQLIKAVSAVNSQTAVVLVGGSMLLTTEWEADVPAIMYSWYAGMEGGHALAEILFGDVVPSGKLPFVVPKSEDQLQEVDFFHADKIRYDYFHGYQKLDLDKQEPQYYFGSGLSYTSFDYSNIHATAMKGAGIKVTFDLRNVGDRDGAEIAEAYLTVPDSKVVRHVRELKGFERVYLKSGESRQIEILIPEKELAYYEEETGSWVIEGTTYQVQVGPSEDPRLLQAAEVVYGF